MTRRETCGDEYARPISVTVHGEAHDCDSFECAIHTLVPTCGHCGIRIIGHGVERGVPIYCGANCARQAGAAGLVEHN